MTPTERPRFPNLTRAGQITEAALTITGFRDRTTLAMIESDSWDTAYGAAVQNQLTPVSVH